MSRVFGRPRYINQARNRLIAMCIHARNPQLNVHMARAMHLNSLTRYTMGEDYEYMAELAIEGEADDHHDKHIDSQLADYLLDSEIGSMLNNHVLSQPEAATSMTRDYIAANKHHAPRRTLTDEAAMFEILRRAYTDPTVRYESPQAMQARVYSKNILSWQLLSQKVAPGRFEEAFKYTPMAGPAHNEIASAEAWETAMENLQYRSQPMWVKYCRLAASPPRRMRDQTAKMVKRAQESTPVERYRFKPFDHLNMEYAAYNYAGVIVIYLDGLQLIIDNSTADYLRTCLTALKNAYLGFSMLRVSGDKAKISYISELKRCVAWIAEKMKDPWQAKYLPRHMHLFYTRWQNSVGEKHAEVSCGWEERDVTLAAEAAAVYPFDDSWWKLVNSMSMNDRIRAEVLKLYHLLPPPDVDPLLLHKSLVARNATANVAKPAEVTAFLSFCKAYDFCRFTAKHREFPKFAVVADYTFQESAWAKSCMSGKMKMPPKEEWGKVWISKQFPYPHTADFHVLNAKDSTRVMSKLKPYMVRAFSRSIPKEENNELLAALFIGEKLSNGETMQEWRARVMAGDLRPEDEVIAAEAGKAENTKVGDKIRETLSACDTVREFLSEVDHSMKPLGELTPGVSMRMGMIKHKKKFQEMAFNTSKGAPRRTFATSTDISAWSPRMDRAIFHPWQSYALGTTECENPDAPIKLWDRLKVFVDRRGVKESADITTGNIQGWPATSDTIMHAHILIYWVYKLREDGILSRGEAAYTLAFIDDAATAVALQGSVDECTKKAQKARDMLESTYWDLGFKMDSVKSFFSSIKFVYLNELYLDGAQVGHGTKTLMRIDKDHTRRFASLTDNIATAMGTAAAAANSGADPFVAYWMALSCSLRWVYQMDHKMTSLSALETMMVALAPVGLNGLGIKPITAVMATGSNDVLTWYTEVVGGVVFAVGSQADRRVFTEIVTQTPSAPSAVSVCRNPFGYKASSHQDASSAVSHEFREAARKKGLAEPYLSLDKIEADEALEEVCKHLLDNATYEASLLEEVWSNMPSAFVDQLLARVEKTEIVAYLLGAKGIGRLRRMVTRCDKMNLATIRATVWEGRYSSSDEDAIAEVFGTPLGKRHGGAGGSERDEGQGSFEYISRLRSKALASAGWAILNHTYPCPFALWAYHGPVNTDTDSSRHLTTLSYDPKRLRVTADSSSLNMYDSVVRGIGYRGYMSSRSDVGQEIKVAFYDPVRRMVASGLAALRWASAVGAHREGLARAFLWSWGGHVDERLLILPGRTHMGSAKRLSLRHSKASHTILMFPNVQAAVKVDARAVTAAQSNWSSMYDMMTAITMLRASGLLEAALYHKTTGGAFAYGFGYFENASAKSMLPSGPEVAADLSIIKRLKPLVDVDSPMAASARAVCSYEGMSEVYAKYNTVSEAAARRAFEHLVESGAMDSEQVARHDQEYLTAKEIRPISAHDPNAWVTRSEKRQTVRGDLVSEPSKIATASAVSEVPRGTSHDQLMHVARSWDDTTLLDAVSRDALLVEELRRLEDKGRAVLCINIDKWDDRCEAIMLTDRQIRSITKEVNDVVGDGHMREGLATVLRAMGFPGLRAHSSDNDEDVLHWVKSFMGVTSVHIARGAHVGRKSNRLRRGTSENYARVVVAEAKNKERTRARVVKAQWLAAAARRQMRAADMAASYGGSAAVTQMNYESVYLRCAAHLLTTRAQINMTAFYGTCITRTIESLTRHVSGEDESEEFEDALEALGMDMEAHCASSSDAEVAITTVCRVARGMSDKVDIDATTEAFRMMCAWLSSDLSGDHVSTPVITRNVHHWRASGAAAAFALTPMGSVGGPAAQPPVKANPVAERPRLIGLSSVVIGAEEEEVYSWREAQPEMVAQWLWEKTEARVLLQKKGKSSFPGAVWERWSASREVFVEWAAEAVAAAGEPDYEEPEFSGFDPVDWDNEMEGIVEF